MPSRRSYVIQGKYFQDRVKSFQEGTPRIHLKQWKDLTSDSYVLTTVSGMYIKITDNLPAWKLCQYSFTKMEQEFVTAEIKALLAKSAIVETNYERRKFIYFTHFCLSKMWWGFSSYSELEKA